MNHVCNCVNYDWFDYFNRNELIQLINRIQYRKYPRANKKHCMEIHCGMLAVFCVKNTCAGFVLATFTHHCRRIALFRFLTPQDFMSDWKFALSSEYCAKHGWHFKIFQVGWLLRSILSIVKTKSPVDATYPAGVVTEANIPLQCLTDIVRFRNTASLKMQEVIPCRGKHNR